jgi:transcriptional regulator with XRE-family HTH domain
MKNSKSFTIFQRVKPLIKQLSNKSFRASYLDSHIKLFISAQIRNLRGDKSQKKFAEFLGTTQSIISRYENPDYGQVTLQTLIDIAKKLDIALIARFVDYSEFLRITSDFSENAQIPKSYNRGDLNLMYENLETEESSAQGNIMFIEDFKGVDSGAHDITYNMKNYRTEVAI